MAKIVIFGNLDSASLAHFYLKQDSHHEPVAFALSEDRIKESTFEGLPVVPFETLEKEFSPREFEFFAPLSPRRMNRLREKIFLEAKAKGFRLISYVSSKATVFPRLKIGENCFILENNTIQPFVTIGDNVILWSGNHIGHHSTIASHVYFSSHVVLSGHCTVDSYCFFGVNATIRDALHIAEGSLIGMGAVILKDTEPHGVYLGNPARPGDKRSDELENF